MRHVNALETLAFIQPLRNFVFTDQAKRIYESLLPPRDVDETVCNNGKLNGEEVMRFVDMQKSYTTRWAGDERFAGKLLVCILLVVLPRLHALPLSSIIASRDE